MSLIEREFMDSLDFAILNASETELRELQKLDLEHQLQNTTFYDVFSMNSHTLKNSSIIPEN